jgi:hypothetical protein
MTISTNTGDKMTKTIPKQLLPFFEERAIKAEDFRSTLELILLDASQPMTAIEVCEAYGQLTKHKVDRVYAHTVLAEMASSGRIAVRVETAAERKIRANGYTPRGAAAKLFWAGTGKFPERTETIIVPGVLLGTGVKYNGRFVGKAQPAKKNKARRARSASSSKTSGLPGKKKEQTGSIEAAIEALVFERTRELQARVSRLEAKLYQIKKLSS